MENNRKTPEDIEKELTPTEFAKQQAVTLGLTFGGGGAGWLAGMGAVKAGLGEALGKLKIKALSGHDLESRNLLVKFSGAIIGTVIGSIAATYGHWKKVERESRGVQEINKDVAAVMEKRAAFEDTLDKQSAYIKKLIAEHEKSSGGMVDKVSAGRDEVAVQARGA